MEQALMFKAYTREWDIGRKGRWVWDDNGEPLMLDSIDITNEERESTIRETEAINSSIPDYKADQIQEKVFDEVNNLADQLVKDPAVLQSGLNVIVLVARTDGYKGRGVLVHDLVAIFCNNL